MHGIMQALSGKVLNALAAVKGEPDRPDTSFGATTSTPFITVSRQPGACSGALPEHLVDTLNKGATSNWSLWDRRLIEKVAADNRESSAEIESLEQTEHLWLTDALSGLASRPTLDEFRVYRQISLAQRNLAAQGHVVLVGRGGFHSTIDLPGGLHIRLIAPLETRIARIAQQEGISHAEAQRRLRQLDEDHGRFYQRHWPGRVMDAEGFCVTFNTARLSEAQIVAAISAMIRSASAEVPREVRSIQAASTP